MENNKLDFNENNLSIYPEYSENINEEDLDEETLDFIINIAKGFIKESFKIYNKWEDYPFAYNEEQSMSALIPAICKYKSCGFVWLEHPI